MRRKKEERAHEKIKNIIKKIKKLESIHFEKKDQMDL